jgi:hypothetical protein
VHFLGSVRDASIGLFFNSDDGKTVLKSSYDQSIHSIAERAAVTVVTEDIYSPFEYVQ